MTRDLSLRCVLIAGSLSSALCAFTVIPAAAHQVRIAFVGDSMADGLWGAMFPRMGRDRCLEEKIALLRHAKNETGLTRFDQFNWIDEIRTLAKVENLDLFVGSFGVNDRQAIVEPDKTRFEFGKPEFDSQYKAILTEAVRGALAEGRQCWSWGCRSCWLQLPTPTLSQKTNSLLTRFSMSARSVFCSRQSTLGEDWYKPYLPSTNSTLIQVRAQDGVHFTPAGYDMVLGWVYPAIQQALKTRGQDPVAECEPEANAK
jgi:uncharacterized protein